MNRIARILLVVAGVLVGLLAAAVLITGRSRSGRYAATSQPGESGQTQDRRSSKQWPLLWGAAPQSCDKKRAALDALPIAVEDITVIQPMGELAQGHVVPGEHIGINYRPDPKTDGVKVFAPADGYIAMIERHQYIPEKGFTSKLRNYHVYLVHSCTLFTGFVHVTNLAPEILAASSEASALDSGTVDSSSKNIWPNIPVKAGQVIGTANGFGLLGMVTVDLDTTITGYLNPKNYEAESWRLHSVAPFDYFPSELKTQLLAKNPRTLEPRGGKFDFDIEGKLVGGWLEPGSGGIKGSGAGLKRCGNFPCPAQDGQVAFVYDYIDPTQLRVSIGHNWGLSSPTPYGVRGNSPNFKDIDDQAGVVRFELVPLLNRNRDHGIENEHPIFSQSDEARVLGTILVELTGNRQIKLEVFPGQSADEISGFTEAARTYER